MNSCLTELLEWYVHNNTYKLSFLNATWIFAYSAGCRKFCSRGIQICVVKAILKVTSIPITTSWAVGIRDCFHKWISKFRSCNATFSLRRYYCVSGTFSVRGYSIVILCRENYKSTISALKAFYYGKNIIFLLLIKLSFIHLDVVI